MATPNTPKRPGIAASDKRSVIQKMRGKLATRSAEDGGAQTPSPSDSACDFKQFADVKKLQVTKTFGKQWDIESMFFRCHDGLAKDTTVIEGRTCLNFSTYDYLGLNGAPELNAAGMEAMANYGSSASGSRPTSGERPPHLALEKGLAELYQTEDCVTFVSGHATNVWTINQFFKKRDLIIYDSLAHNSIVHGAQISGATRLTYPHNDLDALDEILAAERLQYKRCLIVTEGLFSMDGDSPDLARLVELKKKHCCFLMVDEAHSLGVLGATGKGLFEHCNVDPREVDIWMGTLSKTLCGCGGYVAGCSELVECLKYYAPGFMFSVGMPPPMAAVSAKALEMMLAQPERVRQLHAISRYFLEYAQEIGLDTGHSEGFAITPIIIGGSLETAMLSARLFEKGIYALPIMFPAVEEKAARLRFFLTVTHTREQVRQALDSLAQLLPKVRQEAAATFQGQPGDLLDEQQPE